MKDRVSKKYKKFVELLDFSNGKYNILDVFKDFIIIYAIAIKNRLDYKQEDEDIYFQVIKKYEKKELDIFLKLFSELIRLYVQENEIVDVLGEIYEQIGATSEKNSQYFTPRHIAEMMSKINSSYEDIEGEKLIQVNDFACGSGVLLLSYANELYSKDINYAKRTVFFGQDIDFICCCMTYIQMSLYGLAAVIIWGDTLKLETNKVFYTPEYIFGKWNNKLNKNDKE